MLTQQNINRMFCDICLSLYLMLNFVDSIKIILVSKFPHLVLKIHQFPSKT